MNPTMQIGRYTLQLLSVALIKRRTGWRASLKPGYDVLLNDGRSIHFTEAEKQQYDQALERHQQVMRLHGMCKSLGLRA